VSASRALPPRERSRSRGSTVPPTHYFERLTSTPESRVLNLELWIPAIREVAALERFAWRLGLKPRGRRGDTVRMAPTPPGEVTKIDSNACGCCAIRTRIYLPSPQPARTNAAQCQAPRRNPYARP